MHEHDAPTDSTHSHLEDAAPVSFAERFDRVRRIAGDERFDRVRAAHVMVIGVGGVGSFAAEALARSGVGRLTLVDHDVVAPSNTNRQLQALTGNMGRSKAHALADRLRQINPDAKVHGWQRFYRPEDAEELFADRPDWVIDAIDNVTMKCHLLAYCRAEGLRIVCSTGAGGRMDPTAIAVADLAETTIDPLAFVVRKRLRQKHAFPRDGAPFGIPAVYSVEPVVRPVDVDAAARVTNVEPDLAPADLSLPPADQERAPLGTFAFVTGTFGMICASVVVRGLLG